MCHLDPVLQQQCVENSLPLIWNKIMVGYESEFLMICCRSHDGQVKNSMPY